MKEVNEVIQKVSGNVLARAGVSAAGQNSPKRSIDKLLLSHITASITIVLRLI